MLPKLDRRRVVVLAILIAALLGFVGGWFARLWARPSMEDRMQETLDGIRERVRNATK